MCVCMAANWRAGWFLRKEIRVLFCARCLCAGFCYDDVKCSVRRNGLNKFLFDLWVRCMRYMSLCIFFFHFSSRVFDVQVDFLRYFRRAVIRFVNGNRLEIDVWAGQHSQ